MEITELNLYEVNRSKIDSGPGKGWSSQARKSHPMSIFPEYKHIDHSSWISSGAYAPFVVELVTDSGETGFAVNYGGGKYALEIIDDHYRRFVEGKRPFDIGRIWEQMYRAQLPTGHGGLSHMAISAVDLALWDLVGKLTGRPVFDLLGGVTKPELPCYVTTHPTVMHHMADEGFFGVKLSCPWGPTDGREGLRNIESMVVEARELFGEDAEVMIECYMSWNREFAVRAAERLRGLDVKWFEDALLPEYSAGQYRDIRQQIKPIQLAVGNLAWGHRSFHQLINNGAGDVIQPEVQWAGGLTEVKRIAAMAKPHDIPVIPHSAGIYSYHFVMAHVNSPYAEYYVPGDGSEVTSKYSSVIEGDPVPVDGTITLDDSPGFGVELKRDIIELY